MLFKTGRSLRPHISCMALLLMIFSLSSCSVYTIEKATLEHKLNASPTCMKKGAALNQVLAYYNVQHNNHIDTLPCIDASGTEKLRLLSYDSRVTIITRGNKSIRFYAKTLYIWNGEFLIGERSTLTFRKTNYYPVRLKDIQRIEVRG